MASGIYAITNTMNGKVYIGSTQDFEARWDVHRKEAGKGTHWNKHFQNAWNKYGEKTFEFGVLEYLDNLDELVKAEQFWMDIYREEDKELYNYGLAADNPFRGCKHTKESKDSMSQSHTGKKRGPMTEEHKRRIGNANRGKKHYPPSKETRRKMSKSHKGKQNALGCKRSEEFKRNLSEMYKGIGFGATVVRRKQAKEAEHTKSKGET